MNRKTFTSILTLALVCLVFSFLTGCSSSSSTPPPPTIAISTLSSQDATQSTLVGTAFANPLGVTVTSNGSADSSATVTYAATTSSGGATCALSATTATTNSSGQVTSVTCTANNTAGSYTVTATVSGASTPATFNLTNTAVTTATYVFYASGLEAINGGPNYYAVAGAFTLNESANPPTVVSGELDYNDGVGITETAVPITGGTSSITTTSTTGQGTITLNTASTSGLGASGVITLAVQFVNQNHAVIAQFDGSATSSGSMDLQTATSPGSGASNLAFTLSGMDINDYAVGYGGVFTATGGGGDPATFAGTADVNDDGVAVAGGTLGGGVTSSPGTDSYGRGTATFTITNAAVPTGSVTLSLAFYVVGPEVLRMIDIDPENTTAETAGPAAVGSLYGQGTNATAASATSLVTSVFGIESNSYSDQLYAAAGQIVPNSTAGTIGGEGDVDEEGSVTATGTPGGVAGNYTIASNGYGAVTGITGLGDITILGLYATDPTLNLYDPNATTGPGGALLLEMDSTFTSTTHLPAGGTGFLVPQISKPVATDLNASYGFGGQDFNGVGTLPAAPATAGWEFDMVGQAPISSLALTGATGEINDPYGDFTSTGGQYTAVPFAGTAAGPDTAGRYTLPLTVGPVVTGGSTVPFTVVMYEASGSFLFWLDEDTDSLWLGTLEAQAASGADARHLKIVPALKTAKKR